MNISNRAIAAHQDAQRDDAFLTGQIRFTRVFRHGKVAGFRRLRRDESHRRFLRIDDVCRCRLCRGAIGGNKKKHAKRLLKQSAVHPHDPQTHDDVTSAETGAK